jgi:hypothetical protein
MRRAWTSGLGLLAVLAIGCGSSGASKSSGGGEGGQGASGPTQGGGGEASSAGGNGSGGFPNVGSASFTPKAIALDGPGVTNSMRGQYNWLGTAPYPAGWTDVDSYQRWNWDQLETSAGNYKFDVIDQEIAKAKMRHGRFGMRVMPLCEGCAGHMYKGAGSSIPDDLAAAANSLIGHGAGDPDNYVLPDWNSDAYLDRVDALVKAIAARYHDEPTFAWVDVFSYGNWGEFHVYPFDAAGGVYDHSTQRPITDDNAKRIVQRAAAAFDNKLLVLNVANAAADAAAVAITSPPVGFRVDCLGADGLGGGSVIDGVAGAKDHWKTAPFITEWCQVNIGSSMPLNDLFVQGEQQVRDYHISMLSSGNFQKDPTMGAEADAFRKANVEAGYRLRTASVKIEARTDGQTHVEIEWNNDGVAPTYLGWNVVVGVRGASSAFAALKVDLKKVLPGAPLADSENVALGTKLASGKYQVYLRVDDVQKVTPPMQLAMEGRNAAGEYELGSVTIP